MTTFMYLLTMGPHGQLRTVQGIGETLLCPQMESIRQQLQQMVISIFPPIMVTIGQLRVARQIGKASLCLQMESIKQLGEEEVLVVIYIFPPTMVIIGHQKVALCVGMT